MEARRIHRGLVSQSVSGWLEGRKFALTAQKGEKPSDNHQEKSVIQSGGSVAEEE